MLITVQTPNFFVLVLCLSVNVSAVSMSEQLSDLGSEKSGENSRSNLKVIWIRVKFTLND